MKHFATMAVAAIALSLGGCASVIKGGSQSIAISSPPVSGATCTLTSAQGNWTVITPGAVEVSRSKEDVQVRCVKPGYQDGVATIPSSFEGWTVGNLLLGGVIGVGVDAATGAINEYPNAFQVPMQPIVAGAVPSPGSAGPSAQGPLGIHFIAAPATVGSSLGLPPGRGVVVTDVAAALPAAQAGVAQGDIITALGGTPVGSADDVHRVTTAVPAGQKLSIELYRNGQKMTLQATIGQANG